jgi:hypothetical protein
LIAVLILLFSAFMLGKFAVTYCHSLVQEGTAAEISSITRGLARLQKRDATAQDFQRIVSLIALCPFEAGDARALRVVRAYFAGLRLMNVLRCPAPGLWRTVRTEQARCARFVAAALDRRVKIELGSIT